MCLIGASYLLPEAEFAGAALAGRAGAAGLLAAVFAGGFETFEVAFEALLFVAGTTAELAVDELVFAAGALVAGVLAEAGRAPLSSLGFSTTFLAR